MHYNKCFKLKNNSIHQEKGMTLDGIRIAQRVLYVMQNMQLTQKDLAEKLQVTQPAVSKYLQGRVPPPAVLLQLSHLSGLSIEWLLTGLSPERSTDKISDKKAVYGRPAMPAEKINLLPPVIRQPLLTLVDSLLLELNMPEKNSSR
jgi:transcriptional regulator with XRE-family HTH domain